MSLNQASADLIRNIGMAPDTYAMRAWFELLFLKPDAGRYLSQLRSIADGILHRSDAYASKEESEGWEG